MPVLLLLIDIFVIFFLIDAFSRMLKLSRTDRFI